jgi:hypothetical protein
MDAMIIFPKFFDMNTYNTINNHIGIPKNITDASSDVFADSGPPIIFI